MESEDAYRVEPRIEVPQQEALRECAVVFRQACAGVRLDLPTECRELLDRAVGYYGDLAADLLSTPSQITVSYVRNATLDIETCARLLRGTSAEAWSGAVAMDAQRFEAKVDAYVSSEKRP